MVKKFPQPIQTFSARNLLAVWRDSKDGAKNSQKASGVDGVTASNFKQDLVGNITELSKRLCSGEFQFQPLRPILIPKRSGKRVICVPSLADRLVQRCILKRLTYNSRKECERDAFGLKSSISFGVKKGRDNGVQAAIERAVKMRQPKGWAVKTDISAFFDNVPRQYLKQQISTRLGRNSLVPLLHAVVDSEIQPRSKSEAETIKLNKIEGGRGLRQGMPLSPLLSNLVLGKFDKVLFSKNNYSLRYVDDLVSFCDTEEECRAMYSVIENELKKVSLTVPALQNAEGKSQIASPSEPLEFLGVEIYATPSGKYAQRIPDNAIKHALADIEAFGDFAYCQKEGVDFQQVNARMKNKIQGYGASYAACTNLKSFQEKLWAVASAARQKILIEIFGQDAIAKLNKAQKIFMGFE